MARIFSVLTPSKGSKAIGLGLVLCLMRCSSFDPDSRFPEMMRRFPNKIGTFQLSMGTGSPTNQSFQDLANTLSTWPPGYLKWASAYAAMHHQNPTAALAMLDEAAAELGWRPNLLNDRAVACFLVYRKYHNFSYLVRGIDALLIAMESGHAPITRKNLNGFQKREKDIPPDFKAALNPIPHFLAGCPGEPEWPESVRLFHHHDAQHFQQEFEGHEVPFRQLSEALDSLNQQNGKNAKEHLQALPDLPDLPFYSAWRGYGFQLLAYYEADDQSILSEGQKVLELANQHAIQTVAGLALNLIGLQQYTFNDYQASLSTFETAATLFSSMGLTRMAFKMENQIIFLYSKLGLGNQAETFIYRLIGTQIDTLGLNNLDSSAIDALKVFSQHLNLPKAQRFFEQIARKQIPPSKKPRIIQANIRILETKCLQGEWDPLLWSSIQQDALTLDATMAAYIEAEQAKMWGLYFLQMDPQLALPFLEQAWQLFRCTDQPDFSLDILVRIVQAHLLLGDWTQAEQMALQGIDAWRQGKSQDNVDRVQLFYEALIFTAGPVNGRDDLAWDHYLDFLKTVKNVHIPDLTGIQAQLAQNQALVGFFVGREQAFCFTTTSSNSSVSTLSINGSALEVHMMGQLESWRQDKRGTLHLENEWFFNETSFPKEKEQIWLLPDGFLWQFPLHILKAGRMDFQSKQIIYVRKRFDVHIPTLQKPDTLFVLGDESEAGLLPNLEPDAIRSGYRPKRFESKKKLLDCLAEVRFFYYAGHLLQDPYTGEAYLPLSPAERLTPRDIRKLDLSQIRIAVLMACGSDSQSATDDNLTDALLDAGVRTVQATMWETPEKTLIQTHEPELRTVQ